MGCLVRIRFIQIPLKGFVCKASFSHPKDSFEGVAHSADSPHLAVSSNSKDPDMPKKYRASNENAPPPEVRIESWASVVEIMVGIGLFLALLSHVLLPAMLGEHVFTTLAVGAGEPTDGNISLTLDQGRARGMFWFSAVSISLAFYAAIYLVVWAAFAALRKPNLRYLVNSILCVSLSSGDMVRMAAARTPLPQGAEVPVVYMSSLVNIPGIASSGFLGGLQYSILAPFTLVGVAGIVLSLYRIGKSRLDRKLAAHNAGRR